MESRFAVRTHVGLYVPQGGHKTPIWEGKNVIVTNGKQAIARTLAALHPVFSGVAGTDPLKLSYPRHIGFGTSAGSPSDTSLTALVAAANSVGTSTFKQLTDITFPATDSVRFIAAYETGEANHPAALQEMGLFGGGALSGDPPNIAGLVLISRVAGTFSFSKTPAAPLIAEWTYQIQEAP